MFSAQMHRMAEKKLKFERLVVDAAFALEMFKDNQYKSAQVVPLIYSWDLGGGGGVFVSRKLEISQFIKRYRYPCHPNFNL